MDSKRRSFLKKAGIAGAGLISPFANPAFPGTDLLTRFNFEPVPSSTQRSWMDLKFGMFVHFGINTYYDKEWSDGFLDPYRVNPDQLDTMEWCRTALDAGMKYIVLVCKHHDGFCLWPSKYTDYTIARSRYARDIVASLVNSCERSGLKVGMYYSLWDQHESLNNKDDWSYLEFIQNQLEELLTDYGPVVELRFDGFWEKQQSGWAQTLDTTDTEDEDRIVVKTGDEDFIDAWRMEGAYRWQMDHMYDFVKNLQPGCVVMNNSTHSYAGVPLFPVDARNSERNTITDKDRKIWKWLGKEVYVPLQIETTMSTKGNQRFPEGNWFWHEWDHSAMTKKDILSYLDRARASEANLLLNVGPTNRGVLREEDNAVLKALNE